jgi:peptide-methionine (S)-S-oxide reductase
MKRTVALVAVLVAAAGAYVLWSGRDTTSFAQSPADGQYAAAVADGQLQLATFASGCFWCTESDFDKLPGVVSTTSGYTGGRTFRPTYGQVSAGGTGHVESVEVIFNPRVVTYRQLLDVYWHNVDPFNGHGQFCDYGEQYRPVIWVHDEEQRTAAEASRAQVQELLGKTVVVEIEKAGAFYPAEDYHQDFHTKNDYKYRFYRWNCGRDARLADIWRAASD